MNTILVVILFLLVVTICILLGRVFYKDGYKDGQVDAIAGKVKYVLIEFKDGSRAWCKETELKNLKDHTIIKSNK